MDKKIIVAIDGYSSCGKSTLAKDLAKRLGYRYIDTGAMYRAVTFYLLRNNIDIEDLDAVVKALDEIHIDFTYDRETGRQLVILNGEIVEKQIRSREVSEKVSPVSTIHEVRVCLVNQQQRMGLERGIVMDGRDIGTVVFPDAEVKIFMTADEEVRVVRRYEELKAASMAMTMEEVRENLRKRDYIDTHRQESPLRKADDAIVLDNTLLTQEEQLELIYQVVLNITAEAEKQRH